MEKFYVVVNRAFGRGLAVAQAAHAVAAFAHEHGAADIVGATVVCFGAVDTAELERIYHSLHEADVKVTAFHEPDHEGAMTAFVAEGGNKTAKAMSALPFL